MPWEYDIERHVKSRIIRAVKDREDREASRLWFGVEPEEAHPPHEVRVVTISEALAFPAPEDFD